MNKNFLVTISNDTENLYGVNFLCNFFKKASRHQLTLLHICRLDSQDMNKALMKKWYTKDEEGIVELNIGAKKAIEKSKEMLLSSNITIEKMLVKTVTEKFGKVKDILNEGADGLYDAVILGKRASYALQWVFERPADEIAQSIIKDSSFYIPLWICPEISEERTNVLVCIDGSDSSYRAADHAGYILSKQQQHRISLFHVNNGAENTPVDEMFNIAKKLLTDHGIENKRIDTSTSWGLSIPNTILNKINSGKYAAAALGLHGHPHGLLKDFNLAGGTTPSVISKVEKTAIWCCP